MKNKKYVTISASTEAASTVRTGQAKVNTGLLNIRKTASTASSSKILLTVRYGYTVTVLQLTDTWAYVSYNGVKGYCPSRYLTME